MKMMMVVVVVVVKRKKKGKGEEMKNGKRGREIYRDEGDGSYDERVTTIVITNTRRVRSYVMSTMSRTSC